MKKVINLFVLIQLLTASQIILGQTNEQKAWDKKALAIELMDNGKFDESIKLLEEADKLDPGRFEYLYEIAFAHYLQKDYKESIKILSKLTNHKDATDRVFQLLGLSYEHIEKTEKAIETFESGLKIIPNSGYLYLELGLLQINVKDYNKSIEYFEKGIEIAPKFSSNYFWASKLFCSSSEEVWGMIYGEIFLNLEPNTKRSTEISKILFDTYKREIVFTSDSSYSVSFCKGASINVNNITDPSKIKLPFGMLVYEPTLMMSMINEKSIDINSLDRIRRNFIETYFKNESDKKYPNILFNYQNEVLKAGHLEAYNHWILMNGDEAGFNDWKEKNKDKWDDFAKWFPENSINLDDNNKFFRRQY